MPAKTRKHPNPLAQQKKPSLIPLRRKPRTHKPLAFRQRGNHRAIFIIEPNLNRCKIRHLIPRTTRLRHRSNFLLLEQPGQRNLRRQHTIGLYAVNAISCRRAKSSNFD